MVPSIKSNQPFGITVTATGGEFVDFASHFNFVRSSLQGIPAVHGGSIYSFEHQLRVVNEWAGEKINHALIFAYSPTMLFVLAPFVFFSHAAAYCLFNLLGLLAVWWQTHPVRSRLGIGVLAFFGSPALHCFNLGQTAILTGTGLLCLYGKSLDAGMEKRWRSAILPAIVLWALTAKPPFAVTAVTALIGLRRWRPVLLAVVLTVITTGLMWPLLGDGWWRDYLYMLAHYNIAQVAPGFAWSYHPDLMTNLHSVLNVDFGITANLAGRISWEIWIVMLVVLALFAQRLKLTTGCLWSLAVLSYLAFCPYVSDTEEIQLVLLIAFCVPLGGHRLRWQDKLLFVVVPLACFISPVNSILPGNNRIMLFFIKIALMIFIALNYRSRQVWPEGESGQTGLAKQCR